MIKSKYISIFIISFLLISCSSIENIYIAPEFVSNHNLPNKPTFKDENLDYFSDILNPTYSLSFLKEKQPYASALNMFEYNFTWPNIIFDNHRILINMNRNYTFFNSFQFFNSSCNLFQYSFPLKTYFNNYSSSTINSPRSSNFNKYYKPAESHQYNPSNTQYNLARTSNYNYNTHQKSRSSSGYYNDPRIHTPPSNISPQETYNYTPYTPTNTYSNNNISQTNTTTTVQKNKPQQTLAKPNTSQPKKPNNPPIYQQKPTSKPAIPK